MVQSPSWAANWFAASQEIPRISRNPKVHYRTHKRPLLISILGPLNLVHIPTFLNKHRKDKNSSNLLFIAIRKLERVSILLERIANVWRIFFR